jgi:NAD(P)-dependent dehydrogenase (short-subunit alcohol dehydrogenase family)
LFLPELWIPTIERSHDCHQLDRRDPTRSYGRPTFASSGWWSAHAVVQHGGHLAFPAFSLYHATKWGIEGFYEAFAQEVEPFGIHTTLVEPGMIRTSFYEAATRVPVSEPYQGGLTDRKPIPLEQMPGSQTKIVAAMIEAALS